MNHPLVLALLCVGAYLLGSVITAPAVCRLFALPDPRLHGSGNPGATNVYRLGGAAPAIVTLILDAAKGALPVGLAHSLGVTPLWQAIVGLCAITGHMLPLFAGFHGGKGVATAFGAGLALAPATMGVLALVWLLLVWRTRISAVGSIVAALLAPIVSALLDPDSLLLFVLMTLLILVRHRDNLIRLWQHRENKL